jgi:hypothetical protein
MAIGRQFTGVLARRPWIVISTMAHVVALAVVSVMVWRQPADEPPEAMAVVRMTERAPEPPPPPEAPQVVERDEIQQLRDDQIEPNEVETWVDLRDVAPAVPDHTVSELPPGETGGTAIGLRGPGHHGVVPSAFGTPHLGDKFRHRRPVGPRGHRPGGEAVAPQLRDALQWLARHQDDDGRWSAAEFMKHDLEGTPCDGPGNPVNDVGVTGLALLAFLGDGHTLRWGLHRDVVRKGVRWLAEQQGQDGLVGSTTSHEFVYSHAVATLALCEACGLSGGRHYRREAQAAIHWLQRARNPYKVWRYYPRDGDNDTSVTGWCVLALVSAREFGLPIDEDALRCARLWFDEMTDPATGVTGYTRRGEGSSRPAGQTERFPAAKTHALTAVALFCRCFLGDDPASHPVLKASAAALLARPPEWDPQGGAVDFYYWYHASFALFQCGGPAWDAWNRRTVAVLARAQRKNGNSKGSWDPVDAWGAAGGRVYATAIAALTLEACWRYARVLGGR